MAAKIKAIVFKTTRLKESKAFFENILKLSIKEYSARHFVIHSKGIRVVFLESKDNFGIILYINHDPEVKVEAEQVPGVIRCESPDGISIVSA